MVDDEASILTITSQTLQAFGYRVLTATDGADAVAVYAEHKNEIAVVLTDMAMPVMDGPATIHALMRINPAVKIIAASGLNANGGVAQSVRGRRQTLPDETLHGGNLAQDHSDGSGANLKRTERAPGAKIGCLILALNPANRPASLQRKFHVI